MKELYNSSHWRKFRARYLYHHPLCVFCARVGKVTPATILDHIKPHRGNLMLFWDKTNVQGLCQTCHSSIKQRIERKHFGLTQKENEHRTRIKHNKKSNSIDFKFDEKGFPI